jgi:chemotaxis protein methyltransferase CheR
VGETYFFRESGQLEFIRREVMPALLRRRSADAPVRAWSAGCASGEEPYSLAILLSELGLAARTRVLGTDLARARLAAAAEARYGRWSLRGVDDALVRRYFRERDGRYELAPEVRALARFAHLNLADHAAVQTKVGTGTMDLVLCRNVLIYLDEATVRRVAGHLLGALADDGWLFLGASDPSLADYVPCDVVVTGAGIAYRRARCGAPASRPPVRARPSVAFPIESPRVAPPAPPAPRAPTTSAAAEAAQARRHYDARDYRGAADAAQRSVALDGERPEVWALRVRALANAGAHADAEAVCAAALDRHALSAELAYLHALLAAEAGRHEEAVRAARRALYLDRTLVVAHLALGAGLARLGDPAAARRAFANAGRLLADLPRDAEVPMADGEPASRLAALVRARLALLAEHAA